MAKVAVLVALVAAFAAALAAAVSDGARGFAQETGWSVTEFTATYRVEPSGDVLVEERIAVDFRILQRPAAGRPTRARSSRCTPVPRGRCGSGCTGALRSSMRMGDR
jgi:hypothetical protein